VKFALPILAIFLLFSCTRATTTSETIAIKTHEAYQTLSSNDRKTINKIIKKAEKSKRKKYYFKKLLLLLNTPAVSPKITAKMNNKITNDSVEKTKSERRKIVEESEIDLEEYLGQEEFYETMTDRLWRTYKPCWSCSHFYVSDEDPLDILVHIKVHLNGSVELIERILLLEDAIEKHLYVEGFSVNLEFVGYCGNDVFEVNADPNVWVNSHDWSGGHTTLAHELMHLMGLPDEYDGIEIHAGNRHLPVSTRLRIFYQQMGKEISLDATQGIMCYMNLKPLERHICAAVGLDEECVKTRMEVFHEDR